jgi:hypothetical protein
MTVTRCGVLFSAVHLQKRTLDLNLSAFHYCCNHPHASCKVADNDEVSTLQIEENTILRIRNNILNSFKSRYGIWTAENTV